MTVWRRLTRKSLCEWQNLRTNTGVTMTEIALAWLLTKVDAPVAGATKLHHVEGAVKAVDLTLTDEDRNYLEELYVPHPLVGVMAQNTQNADSEGQAWAKHAPKE